jgi:hypothetical protein
VPYPPGSDDLSRFDRFPLRLPIRYRPVGAVHWTEGTTENISAHGVLVRTTALPPLHTALDFRFQVEVGPHRSDVACRGSVVRTVPGSNGGEAFAATIDAFTFLPHET